MSGLFKKWGKQVAVRFEPNELTKLDALVSAMDREKRQSHAYYYWRPLTRSEVIRSLVVAAANAREREAAAAKPKKTAKKKGGR